MDNVIDTLWILEELKRMFAEEEINCVAMCVQLEDGTPIVLSVVVLLRNNNDSRP